MALKTWLDLLREPDPSLNFWVRSAASPQYDVEFWLAAQRRDPSALDGLRYLFIEREVWPLDDHTVLALVEVVDLGTPARAEAA